MHSDLKKIVNLNGFKSVSILMGIHIIFSVLMDTFISNHLILHQTINGTRIEKLAIKTEI